VLTPFESAGGEWLLVDRGWVPLGGSRTVLPKVDVADNMRTITGRVDELPQPGMRLREAANSAPLRWPHVISFPRHEEIETALGRKVPSRRILLDPDQDDGFQRGGALRLDFGPDRHVAYAVQWFALAAAVVAMFIAVIIKAPRLRP
jgi:surfeit locus 1 family protein